MQPSLDTLAQRLKHCRFERNLSQTTLAALAGVKQSSISDLERGESRSSGHCASIAHVLGVNALWLATGAGEKTPSGAPLGLAGERAYTVPLINSPGNCGSSRPRMGNEEGPLTISSCLFDRREISTPKMLLAIVADGDSMAPFISDGDIVVFDAGDSSFPASGVFLFDTVDGLRIMRAHFQASGRLALSRDSHDKNRYPDEVLLAEDAKLLKVKGRLVLRMG